MNVVTDHGRQLITYTCPRCKAVVESRTWGSRPNRKISSIMTLDVAVPKHKHSTTEEPCPGGGKWHQITPTKALCEVVKPVD